MPADFHHTHGWSKALKRNQWAAPCSYCGETVPPGDGYLSKSKGRWTVAHALHCPDFGGRGYCKDCRSPKFRLITTEELLARKESR